MGELGCLSDGIYENIRVERDFLVAGTSLFEKSAVFKSGVNSSGTSVFENIEGAGNLSVNGSSDFAKLSVTGTSLFQGTATFENTATFNTSATFQDNAHFDGSIKHNGHHKGHLISNPIDQSVRVMSFSKALPSKAIIKDLYLTVINGSLQADGVGAKLELDLTGLDGTSYMGGIFINSSDSVLKADRTYSILKDWTSNASLELNVWNNASNYFIAKDAPTIDSSEVHITSLKNASSENDFLALSIDSTSGTFQHNCSLQAFINYESPFILDNASTIIIS
jgi:hypothetical protein